MTHPTTDDTGLRERRTESADTDLAGGGPPASGGHDDHAEPGRYSRQHGERASDQGSEQAGAVRVLEPALSDRLRSRWNEVQAGFVDEPRQSVTQADGLVGEVLDEVSRVFRDQRAELEQDWNRDGEPDTEELRQALRRYREFFDRLLSL